MSEEVKSASESKKEDWMNSKWRPMMGWMYMLVCTMDMVVFPILWSLLQTTVGTGLTQWNPLTLQGAGLFHIAMGAVLGIAAFGRTQEKLGGANNGGLQTPGTGFAGGAPAFGAPQAGFGAAPSTSYAPAFGAPQAGFGAAPSTSYAPAPSWGTTPIPGGGNSNTGFGAATAAPRSFSSAPLGAAAVGAAGGFAAATMMPSMDKPMPSRPPFEEDFPEID